MLDHTATTELPEEGLQGLTSKQMRFALLLFQGLSQSDAYREAYRITGDSANSVGVSASNLANSPKIVAKLTELRRQVEGQATLAPTLTREWILNGIMGLARNAKKENVQLAAYIALGKVAGVDLFRDIVVRETKPRTVEDVEQELRARLKQLGNELGDNAKDITPQPAAIANPSDRRRKPRT